MSRFGIVLLLLASGCYHPNIGDGEFACGSNNACPAGFTCGGGRCFGSSVIANLDFTVGPFRGDGTLGARDLSGHTGTLTLNTLSGVITLSDSADPIVGPGTPGFSVVPQPSGGPPLAIWNFTDLTIPAGVDVALSELVGVPVLAATGTISIDGDVKLSPDGEVGGNPGLNGKMVLGTPASGGGASGAGAGGGGAGYATAGHTGDGTGAGAAGAAYGTETLSPLYFGAGGGGGNGPSGSGGAGGGGGGALALFGREISIGGILDVSGELVGHSGKIPTPPMPAGGGGGGAGGSLLISANTVTLKVGHKLRALGGGFGMGAGGGGNGGAGEVGRIWIGSRGAPGGTLDSLPPATSDTTGPITQFPR